MVVPRFGPANGDLENLIRGLARHLRGDGVEVEVAATWSAGGRGRAAPAPIGTRWDGGVRVHRFPVAPPGAGRRARRGNADQVEGRAWSAQLQRFVEEGSRYDLLVFTHYGSRPALAGLRAWPERSALLPYLGDGPPESAQEMSAAVESSAGCIFTSRPEERLVRRLHRVRAGGVVGIGVDPPDRAVRHGFGDRHGLGRYLLCVAGAGGHAGVDAVAGHVARYASERATNLRLAVAGQGTYRAPPGLERSVVPLGPLYEEEARAARAGALAVVEPSERAVLALGLLQAWREGTPVLVAEASAVMVEHCRLSGGGFAFAGYEAFAAAVDRLLGDPASGPAMGALGQQYALDVYGWPAVRRRMRAVLERLAGARAPRAVSAP